MSRRRFVQVAVAASATGEARVVYAVADDGTAWWTHDPRAPQWQPIAELPAGVVPSTADGAQ